MVGRLESGDKTGPHSTVADWADVYRSLIPGPPSNDAVRSNDSVQSAPSASRGDNGAAAAIRTDDPQRQILLAANQRADGSSDGAHATSARRSTFDDLIRTTQTLPAEYRDRPMLPAADSSRSRSAELGFTRLYPDGDRNTMCWIDVSSTNGSVLERHFIDRDKGGTTTTVHETFEGARGDERCKERRQTRTGSDGKFTATETVFDLAKPGEVAVTREDSVGHFITSKTWYDSDGKTPIRIEGYLKNLKDGLEENDAIAHPKKERYMRAHTEYLEVPPIPGDPMRVHVRDATTGEMRSSDYSVGNKVLMDLPGDPAKLVPVERQKVIDQAVRSMEDAFAHNEKMPGQHEGRGDYQTNTLNDGTIDFREYGKLLFEIANQKDWTEPEKLYAWTRLNGDEGTRYTISTEHSNEKTLDSFRGSWDPYHAFLKAGARDGYHGPMFSMDEEDSSRLIEKHEIEEMTAGNWLRRTARWGAGLVLGGKDGINEGDIQASRAQAAALRQMRADGFIGYATEWNKRFVDSSEK